LLLAIIVFALSVALWKSGHGLNWWVAGAGAGALVIFGVLYATSDITAWSLHPF